uniref:Uncharacterized protein n=1 Tax=Anguilla anguilla TaxID=7936 RepID=A0A0E9U4A9_ANGAN
MSVFHVVLFHGFYIN